jgi:hypothetical protein
MSAPQYSKNMNIITVLEMWHNNHHDNRRLLHSNANMVTVRVGDAGAMLNEICVR